MKIFFLFGVVIIITAFHSVGYYHLDEHFQILEFANWKLGKISSDKLTWEFPAQIRPSLQPSIVVWLYQFFDLFDKKVTFSHFHLATILRLITGVLFFIQVFAVYQATKDHVAKILLPIKGYAFSNVYLFLLGMLWFIPFNHIRFSSESWSSSLVVIGLAGMMNGWKIRGRYLIIGLIFGLAFWARFQVGIIIFGAGIWWKIFRRKENDYFSSLFKLGLGLGFSLFLGFLVDRWFYGEWVFTPFNYFMVNIVEGKAAEFGTDPFWFYLVQGMLYLIPPFSILIVILCVGFFLFYPKHILTWSIGLFFVIHCLISHKEIRFIIPGLVLIPYFCILAADKITKIYPKFFNLNNIQLLKTGRILLKVFLVLNGILLIVIILRPGDDLTYLSEKVYADRLKGSVLLINEDDTIYIRANGIFTRYYIPENLDELNLADDDKNILDFNLKTWREDISSIIRTKTSKNYDRYYLVREKPLPDNSYNEEYVLSYQLPAPWLDKLNFFNWYERSHLRRRYIYQFEPVFE